MAKTITNIMRRKRGGAVGFEKWAFAHRIVPCDDPEGAELPKDWDKAAILDADLPKIPADVWSAVAALYVHFMESEETKDLIRGQRTVDNGLEVAVFFTMDIDTRKVRAWVPTQAISKASVEIDYEMPIMDLVTGEKVEAGIPGLPDSEIKIGTSHSHNTMGAYFSGTDDRNELGQPGIHLVAGEFKSDGNKWAYAIASSLVMGGKRYRHVMNGDREVVDMNYKDLIEYDGDEETTFDRGVLDLISLDVGSFRLERDSKTGGSQLQLAYGLQDDEDDYYTRYQYGGFMGGGYDHRSYERVECDQRVGNGYYSGKCGGDVSTHSGYCQQCGHYYSEHDARGPDMRQQDLSAEPVYDSEGDLFGYFVMQGASRKYITVDDRNGVWMVGHMRKRRNWETKSEPWKNVSKSMRKKMEADLNRQKDRSTYHNEEKGPIKEKVLEIMRDNHLLLSQEHEARMAYTLTEFAAIIKWLGRAQDPNARIQDTLRDIVRQFAWGDMHLLTDEDFSQLTDRIEEAGLDWTEIEELNS